MLRFVITKGLYDFGKTVFCMDPATGDGQVIPLFCQGVVDLVAIRNEYPGVVIQKFFRVIGFSGWLIIVQDYRAVITAGAVAVYPHITVS